ncbi:uncharacterized protein BJ212DRAFT_570819 [Suillus subaureus]|uniref:F-box domain-containing protein n=1 Tax=Suillus subaureus TaxID=48587 RepID=A0A9P7JAF5_9AGAM|nr:uncharacterized protein BJ212DRAFT_570819 [Suillus subaureus]KAG1810844.1 hypothetical protein BJ212DRAFT_570819 [Suillus subaureus]
MTANSKANFSSISDIIGVLQNILAHSQVIIPDLETQYPISNMHYSAFNLNYQNISAIITERQQRLDATSHEISRFETIIDDINHIHQQLVAKKDKITQSMNLHKRLVSALWRLPAEVLSQIFVHCLPNRLSPVSQAAPMLLTRICRRWREVAVDMSSLWQGLYVCKDWQRAACCYEPWLKRLRGRPLSLELQCYKNSWTELRSLLQPYINQVSSLSLNFSYDVLQPEVMISDFLALEELTISLHLNSQTRILQSISQPPCTLRSLTVTGLFFDMEYASTLNPAWARLTNIQIDLDEASAFPQMLRLCPSLSSLTITTCFIAMEALEPFTHAQLQSLRIISDDCYDDDTEHFNLFDTLSLPNLRALQACDICPWPHEEFKAFLMRSKCPLESLTLSFQVLMTDEQRAEYVALIPSLKVLVT